MDHRPSLPSARRLTSLSVALLLAVGMLAVPTAMPAAATDPYTISRSTADQAFFDGSAPGRPIIYEITFDCSASPSGGFAEETLPDDAVDGKSYRLVFTGDNTCLSGIGGAGYALLSGSPISDNQAGASIGMGAGTTTLPLNLNIDFGYSIGVGSGERPEAYVDVEWTNFVSRRFILKGEPATGSQQLLPPPPFGPPSSSSTPDPIAGAVSVAAEQVAAAGVAGSSGAVRVRGGAPVPVSSTVVSSVGPRGGVVVEGDGMRVAVASTLGASADAGVRAPSGGPVDVSVAGPLTPGAVIEVWVRSEPRLVAAAAVPADYEEGDAVTFTVPLAAPLDGGDGVEDGEHTLELRLYTADGFEVIATGLTVGSIAPTSIPAGEGPASPSRLAVLGLLAAGGALLAARRGQVVAG